MHWLTWLSNFGWAKQADRQDFNHIPAAQWVITKNGTASTASITIQNREFNDLSDNAVGLNKKTVQLYAVKIAKMYSSIITVLLIL